MRLSALIVATFVLAPFLACAGEDPRVGWEENFDTIERWKKTCEKPLVGDPPASYEGRDGVLRIVTCRGCVGNMTNPDWADYKYASGFTKLEAAYEDVVDFDKYHYLVVRTPAKGTFALLLFAFDRSKDIQTKVLYTTGVHAEDLKPLGLSGKQRVRIQIQLLNSSGVLALDYIRLVSELSPEEKAGFIDQGFSLREEKIRSHPYQGLEALNSRAGRPIKFDPLGGEQCVFREFGTQAQVWKMTQHPNDDTKVDFNCDGSAFSIQRRSAKGFVIYDYTTRKFQEVVGGVPDAAPFFSTSDPDSMIMTENRNLTLPRRELTINKYNFRTGAKTKIASFQTETKWTSQKIIQSPGSSKLVFSFDQYKQTFLIDPEIPEIDKRVQEYQLPKPSHGTWISADDKEFFWGHTPYYERIAMDRATGKWEVISNPEAGGHNASNGEITIAPYGDLMRIMYPRALRQQTEADAEKIRIFANFSTPVGVDYGRLVGNRYFVTDGSRGELAGKHVMFPMKDPAGVLQIVNHNTSRNNWNTNTYSWNSPDATKLAWTSDQFDDGDIYMAVAEFPAPPENLAVKRDGAANILSFQRPRENSEIAGYRIYRSTASGGPYEPVAFVDRNTHNYSDAGAPVSAFYAAATVEPSRIEGYFASEAAVNAGTAPRTIYSEAELAENAIPARAAFRGDASGSRYSRIYRASPSEPAVGEVKFALNLPPGDYALWVRGRAESENGSWDCKLQGLAGKVFFAKSENSALPEFKWAGCTGRLKVSGRDTLVLSSAVDGLSVDQIALSSDPSFDPVKQNIAAGPLARRPEPAAAVESFDVTAQSVKLRWRPSESKNIQRYDIHALGADGKANGNATIIASTQDTSVEDWGLKPDTAYRYAVVAVDSRDASAEPAIIEVKTAQQEIQDFTVSVDRAQKDAPVAVVKNKSGAPLLTLPAQTSETGKITYAIDVRAAAPFMIWMQYRPAYVDQNQMFVMVQIDGATPQRWNLRHPYDPLTRNLFDAGKPKEERTWTDKVVLGVNDVFNFAPGKHTISIQFDPKLGETQHAFGTLYASNDHSFRPEGYSPRANFTKKMRN